MLKILNQKPNVDLLVYTKFEGFITHDKHVHGINVRNTVDDMETKIISKRGVIAASGGFSADIDFRKIQNPVETSQTPSK
jgi:glycerol-3-phosphate dehydrogenase